MNIPESNTEAMNEIIVEKYGFWFGRTYNVIEAPRIFNKDYNSKKDSGKSQYIKFYDDIKIEIDNKIFIISKDEIEILDNGSEEPEYRYKEPIDVERSNFNNITVDLGVIEILNKDGEILRPKIKVPALLIKRVYYKVQYRDNFASTPEAVFYDGWAENYPKDDRNLKPISVRTVLTNKK